MTFAACIYYTSTKGEFLHELQKAKLFLKSANEYHLIIETMLPDPLKT